MSVKIIRGGDKWYRSGNFCFHLGFSDWVASVEGKGIVCYGNGFPVCWSSKKVAEEMTIIDEHTTYATEIDNPLEKFKAIS